MAYEGLYTTEGAQTMPTNGDFIANLTAEATLDELNSKNEVLHGRASL